MAELEADGAAAALVRRAIDRLAEQRSWIAEPALRRLPEVQAILTAPDDVRREAIHELAAIGAADEYPADSRARAILSMATRKQIELAPDDARALLTLVRDTGASGERGRWIASALGNCVAKRLEANAPSWSDAEVEALAPLLTETAAAVDDDALGGRLRQLASREQAVPLELISQRDDAGKRMRLVVERSPEDAATLGALLELMAGLPASGKPSRKWIATADAVRDALHDPGRLGDALIEALLAAEDFQVVYRADYTGTHFFHPRSGNEDLAVAIVRFAARVGAAGLLPGLRRLARKCVAVIGGEYGSPRSLKLANAAAQAIADIGAPASITELLALERSVRHGTLLKQIRKAIDTLADAQGMTRDELLERAVESHDLGTDGRRDVPLRDGAARLEVDACSVSLTYVDPDGEPRKTIPAAVKAADAYTIEVLRSELKEIRKTIAGERARLDALLGLDRRWDVAEWRALYLDHPVTGRMARALIWTFPEFDAVPLDATSGITSAGDTVRLPAEGQVRLWHPIDAAGADVHAWRQQLLERRRAQPIKQAFRETYALTPAEADTATYSNRFAAHVFRQVQARALMKRRGWSPVPLAWWDDGIDHGVARREFERLGVRAEFFYDPVLEYEPQGGDLYPYCTSDQVRFFAATGEDPMPLADVPPVVFSEAMRDVDLFIGVTSIGADPQWLDRGDGPRFETYWHTFGFGELTEPARVRRAVVEQLLPKLAIADRCELEERFLVVRGTLRSYRIHLGSGNILMSPNDRYLCIVAARDGRANKLFLPFDDDPMLSVVLSKAFMLAEDTKIEDDTIVAQINAE